MIDADDIADFRKGPPVQPEPEMFGHLRAVATLAEVLRDLFAIDLLTALAMAEVQIRQMACERLADWDIAGTLRH